MWHHHAEYVFSSIWKTNLFRSAQIFFARTSPQRFPKSYVKWNRTEFPFIREKMILWTQIQTSNQTSDETSSQSSCVNSKFQYNRFRRPIFFLYIAAELKTYINQINFWTSIYSLILLTVRGEDRALFSDFWPSKLRSCFDWVVEHEMIPKMTGNRYMYRYNYSLHSTE